MADIDIRRCKKDDLQYISKENIVRNFSIDYMQMENFAKDPIIITKAEGDRQVPGHGHLLFEEILKTLSDIGFDGPLSFRCLPIPDWETASLNANEY